MKYLTTGRIFAAILGLTLFMFLTAGTESLLTKWGFETKTTLIRKLEAEKKDHQKAKEVNTKNLDELKTLRARQKELLDELQNLTDKKTEAENVLKEIQAKHQNELKKVREQLNKKKKVTETEIILPRQEVDEMSAIHINTLHDAFDQFFPKEPPHEKTVPLSYSFDLPAVPVDRGGSIGLRTSASDSLCPDRKGLRHGAQAVDCAADTQAHHGSLGVPEAGPLGAGGVPGDLHPGDVENHQSV